MCQPVNVAVAVVAVLLGSLLLLSCAEESAAAKVKSFNLAQCREIVQELYATYCYRVKMSVEHPPADSHPDTARKRRNTDAVSQTGGSTEDFTEESEEPHTQFYGSKESSKSAGKFFGSYKRNPLGKSSTAKLNKVAQKRTEDLLGFDASKEELADIYNSTATREPRNLRNRCSEDNERKVRGVMKMFAQCCPDLKKCFEQGPHIRSCYHHYKRSCPLN